MDKFIEYIISMSEDNKKRILDALIVEQNGIKSIEKKNNYKEAFEIARKKALDETKETIEYYKIDLLICDREKGAWREAAAFIKIERYVRSNIKMISFEEYCDALKDPDFNNHDITTFNVETALNIEASFSDKKYKNDLVYAAERIHMQIIWGEDKSVNSSKK